MTPFSTDSISHHSRFSFAPSPLAFQRAHSRVPSRIYSLIRGAEGSGTSSPTLTEHQHTHGCKIIIEKRKSI